MTKQGVKKSDRIIIIITNTKAIGYSSTPNTSMGLGLSDEELRISVADWLWCKACELDTCYFIKVVTHADSKAENTPRQQRHSYLNDIIWGAMKMAQVPAVKDRQGASGPAAARRQTFRRHHDPRGP